MSTCATSDQTTAPTTRCGRPSRTAARGLGLVLGQIPHDTNLQSLAGSSSHHHGPACRDRRDQHSHRDAPHRDTAQPGDDGVLAGGEQADAQKQAVGNCSASTHARQSERLPGGPGRTSALGRPGPRAAVSSSWPLRRTERSQDPSVAEFCFDPTASRGSASTPASTRSSSARLRSRAMSGRVGVRPRRVARPGRRPHPTERR
jgi:hypothetical protein